MSAPPYSSRPVAPYPTSPISNHTLYHSLPSPPMLPEISLCSPPNSYSQPSRALIEPHSPPSTPPRTPKLPSLSLSIPTSFSPPPIPITTSDIPAALQIVAPLNVPGVHRRPRSSTSHSQRPKSYLAYSKAQHDPAEKGNFRQGLPPPEWNGNVGGYMPFRRARAVSMETRPRADMLDGTPNPVTGRRMRVAGGFRETIPQEVKEVKPSLAEMREKAPIPVHQFGLEKKVVKEEKVVVTTPVVAESCAGEVGWASRSASEASNPSRTMEKGEKDQDTEGKVLPSSTLSFSSTPTLLTFSGLTSPSIETDIQPPEPLSLTTTPTELEAPALPETELPIISLPTASPISADPGLSGTLLRETFADLESLLAALPGSPLTAERRSRRVSFAGIHRTGTYESMYSPEDNEETSPTKRPRSWGGSIGGGTGSPASLTPVLMREIRKALMVDEEDEEGSEEDEEDMREVKVGMEQEVWDDDIEVVLGGIEASEVLAGRYRSDLGEMPEETPVERKVMSRGKINDFP